MTGYNTGVSSQTDLQADGHGLAIYQYHSRMNADERFKLQPCRDEFSCDEFVSI